MADYSIKPGPGWRLLQPGELVQSGDQYISAKGWTTLNIASSKSQHPCDTYRRKVELLKADGGGQFQVDATPITYDEVASEANPEPPSYPSNPMEINLNDISALQGIANASPATKAKVQGMVHAAGFKSLLELAKSNYYRKEKTLQEIKDVVKEGQQAEEGQSGQGQAPSGASQAGQDADKGQAPNMGEQAPSQTDIHLTLADVEAIAKKVASNLDMGVKGDTVEGLNKLQDRIMARLTDMVASIAPTELVVKDSLGKLLGRVVGARHKQFEEILDFLLARNAAGFSEFILIYGAAGAGKTYLTRQLGEAMGVRSQAFPCGPTMTEGKLLGYNNVVNGEFVKGWLYDFYKNGGLAALDEIFLADPSVLAAMNSLEGDEFTFGNGELVKRHPDFHMIAFDNTIGAGATKGYKRNAADAATLNRLTYVELTYDEELEKKVYGNPGWADYVIRVRKYVETNCNNSFYVTPRATRKGAAYLARGISPERVCNAVLFGPCSKDVKAAILKSVGVFGESNNYGKGYAPGSPAGNDPLAAPAGAVQASPWQAKIEAMAKQGQQWNKATKKFEKMSKFDDI